MEDWELRTTTRANWKMGRNVVREQSFSFARRDAKLAKYLQSERKDAVRSGQLLKGRTSIAALVGDVDSSVDVLHQFEDLPAADCRASDEYLQEVEACDVYPGLFGHEDSWEDSRGRSATERESHAATESRRTRLIYGKRADERKRRTKLRARISRAANEMIRDYASDASVQVMLFVDRQEITNSVRLPDGVTIEYPRHSHSSVPRNPLRAEPMHLTPYIERVGSGTGDMIRLCREAGLPEPTFSDRDGFMLSIARPGRETSGDSRKSSGKSSGKEVGRVGPARGGYWEFLK